MITNEINFFIKNIMEKTVSNELDWQYAEPLLCDINEMPKRSKPIRKLAEFCQSSNTSLYIADSFYLYKNDQYLFLLHIDYEDEDGNSANEIWGLYAILSSQDNNFIPIPDYHPANESDRLKKISGLIVKNKAAEKEREEKRLKDFLRTFI